VAATADTRGDAAPGLPCRSSGPRSSAIGRKGIDGKLYFHDSIGGPSRQVIFSVKAGNLAPTYVRDLWGVLEAQSAEIASSCHSRSPGAIGRHEVRSG